MRKFYSFIIAALLATFGFVATAQAQSLDEILANPKVDDIYIARLDNFSKGFDDKAYGMMRVVEVDSKKIVLVTEDAAWPDSPDGAYDELKGDFSDIGWDFEEKIEVERAELGGLKTSGMLLRGRRLTAEQIKDYLN
ncbi:MAG: hypothetical protein ACRCWP_04995 [Shewanella sp.]